MIHWCTSHNRQATHRTKEDKPCCDPNLPGILLPCSIQECPNLEEQLETLKRLAVGREEYLTWIIRQLFYYRLPLGDKVCDHLDPELWERCFKLLKNESNS